MSCPDLCTAAKCAELENRISVLEQHIELLEAAFISHTQQSIPKAHQYTPKITVDLAIANGELITTVELDNQNSSGAVELPNSVIPNVTFDIFNPNKNEYVFKVGVNGEFDEDHLILEDPELTLTTNISNLNQLEIEFAVGEQTVNTTTPLPLYDVALDNFEIDDEHIALAVQVGVERAETIIHLPSNDLALQSNLKIDGSFKSDVLTLTVADGESFDTASIFIPTNDSPQTIFITE